MKLVQLCSGNRLKKDMNSTNLVNIKICIVISLSGRSSGSDFAMNRFDKDSEVYKMIQENKESRIPPRQSNTFKMLQEVLEADERGEEKDMANCCCAVNVSVWDNNGPEFESNNCNINLIFIKRHQ